MAHSPENFTAGWPDDLERLVNRFLSWPLPNTVASDPCVTRPGNSLGMPRVGTNLLTANEARQMIKYLLEL